MTTLTFEIESTEVDKIKAVLKALGARKLKVTPDEAISSKLGEKLRRSKKGKGTELLTADDVSIFLNRYEV